ncbi:MAG: hydroxyacylglutathione hydrolase [Candidatus Cloacimonadota bacterium]|jgi:glyoxylase-like metal-dependent hydrolase (beta-lactamase superfamily II)|nr:hydroxyacylglutathione hydrolase [Candidatus Cloacimonadota bacterium]
MKIKTFNLLPSFGTNTYLVWEEESGQAMLIDPAAPSEEIVPDLASLTLKFIVLTHGHGDHIAGVDFFAKLNKETQVCIHEKDSNLLTDPNLNFSAYMDLKIQNKPADILLQDGDVLQLGKTEIQVLHTPGHTQGGICLYSENVLFSGDTLFNRGIGRTDLLGGNYQALVNSIKKKLWLLPDSTKVYPGHGPATTIGEEKMENPIVGLMSKV